MKKLILTIGLITINVHSSDLQAVTSSYITEIDLIQKETEKAEMQTHFNKAKEYAKVLLGIVSNVKINTSNKSRDFCKLLEKKISSLEESTQSEDKKISLKSKRDIENFKEIAKFLKCVSKLLDSFYEDSQLIDLILEKIPEFVPTIGQEITILLRVLELTVNSDENFDKAITKIREFARQSEDGNYLISPLISIAMEMAEAPDYKKILTEKDFSKLEICKYLKIR